MKSLVKVSNRNIRDVLDRVNTRPKSVRLFDNGFINPIYFVKTTDNRELVFRVTNPLRSWRKLKTLNEVTCINFLKENTGIPVPNILDYSLDTKLIGYEYMLYEKIPGRPLSEIYSRSSGQQKREYLSQVAGMIVQMKRFRFDRIGSFQENMKIGPDVDTGKGPFDDVNSYFKAVLNKYIRDMKFVPETRDYAPRFRRFKTKVLSGYNPRLEYVFTHNDLSSKNFLVKDGKITGLIDFEWAGSFPYTNDITGLDFDFTPRAKEEFYEILKRGKVRTKVNARLRELHEVMGIACCLAYYKSWFVDNPKKAGRFMREQSRKADRIFGEYGI